MSTGIRAVSATTATAERDDGEHPRRGDDPARVGEPAVDDRPERGRPDRHRERVDRQQHRGLDERGDRHVPARPHPAERRPRVQAEQTERDGPDQEHRDDDEEVSRQPGGPAVVTVGTSAASSSPEPRTTTGANQATTVDPPPATAPCGRACAGRATAGAGPGRPGPPSGPAPGGAAPTSSGAARTGHHGLAAAGHPTPSSAAPLIGPPARARRRTSTNDQARYRWTLPLCSARPASPTRATARSTGRYPRSSTTSRTRCRKDICGRRRARRGRVATERLTPSGASKIRTSGSAYDVAVYCIRGLTRAPPQPQPSSTARRGARRRSRDRDGATTSAATSAATVSSASGSSTGRARPPAPVRRPPRRRRPRPRVVPAAVTPSTPTAPAGGRRERPGHETEPETASAPSAAREPLGTTDLVRGGRRVAARPAEERDPERLGERHQGQARGECDDRDGQGRDEPQLRVVRATGVDERLEQGPLRDEPRGHGQPGGAEGRDAERGAGPGHRAAEAAEPVEVPQTGGMQHRPRGEEEDRLRRGVPEREQQRGDEQHVTGLDVTAGRGHLRGADGDEDQADVLGRRVGEQPLEVGGDARLEDPEDRRRGPEHEQREPPPGRSGREQPDDDEQHAVDAGLDHGRAHQGAHVARRLRVRARQPDVHGHRTGLGGEAEQQQADAEAGRPGVRGEPGQVRPPGPARGRGEDGGPAEDEQEGQLGHPGVPQPRAHDLGTAGVVGEDEDGRGDRHHLPGEQERDDVVRCHDPEHPEHEQGVGDPRRPGRRPCPAHRRAPRPRRAP